MVVVEVVSRVCSFCIIMRHGVHFWDGSVVLVRNIVSLATPTLVFIVSIFSVSSSISTPATSKVRLDAG